MVVINSTCVFEKANKYFLNLSAKHSSWRALIPLKRSSKNLLLKHNNMAKSSLPPDFKQMFFRIHVFFQCLSEIFNFEIAFQYICK